LRCQASRTIPGRNGHLDTRLLSYVVFPLRWVC